MPKKIKTWKELVGLESENYKLEIELIGEYDGCGWIEPKVESEEFHASIYLSTHTFYSGTYKYYTYWLQRYGFDVQLENWDGKTEEINCSDQWLHEGRCDLCRKQKYCKNECKPSKNRTHQFLRAAVAERMFGR